MADTDRKRVELQRAQADNLQTLLRNPPSTTFWSGMGSEQKAQWLRDNVPDWDNLDADRKGKVYKALEATESRTQAIAAGRARGTLSAADEERIAHALIELRRC